jgi:oligopeptide transport system substrate-binding protein
MNDSGWSNQEYDALLEKALSTIDQTERYKLLAKAESILLNELPVIPFYFTSYSVLIADEVKGTKVNAIERIRFKDIYLDNSLNRN